LGKVQADQDKTKRENEARDHQAVVAKLGELEEDLKEIASAYVGKMGRTLVEKELALLGGRQCLLNKEGITKLLSGLEKSAKLLTSGSKIQEMLKTLDAEISSRTGM
jgi:hypothetical protein